MKQQQKKKLILRKTHWDRRDKRSYLLLLNLNWTKEDKIHIYSTWEKSNQGNNSWKSLKKLNKKIPTLLREIKAENTKRVFKWDIFSTLTSGFGPILKNRENSFKWDIFSTLNGEFGHILKHNKEKNFKWDIFSTLNGEFGHTLK